jgi:predicted Rossmann fold flavoprotein
MLKPKSDKWDVIVIGGGPAGMMAASVAGERGRKVLLLDKNRKLGKKLSITGGGRCNVTNNKPDVRTMLSSYKDSGKFLFSTFMQFGVTETIEWFDSRDVSFVEENEGRLFPETLSAETIRSTMMEEVKKQNVVVKSSSAVSGVTYNKKNSEFEVTLEKGEVYVSESCVVASGGTSRPETGSTGEGFNWLRDLDHSISENDFALVPVALKDKWVIKVSGVTLSDVKITLLADGKKHMSKIGKLLFTHVGVSGPTILNMSSEIGDLALESNVTLELDLFPKKDEGTLRKELNELMSENSNKKLQNILPEIMPRALAVVSLEQIEIDGETPAHSVSSEDRKRIVSYIKHLPLSVKGLLGADKAVVSSGGVSLTEIDFKTMGSRIIPKLYVVGDVLDIDRPSGGYSLQLCWSTGFVAGKNA